MRHEAVQRTRLGIGVVEAACGHRRKVGWGRILVYVDWELLARVMIAVFVVTTVLRMIEI
jgi:hypothetical protein